MHLALVDGDDLGELIEHDLGSRLAAQHEAGEGHDEEEDGDEAGQEAEGETGCLKESPVGAEVRDRRAEASS